METLVLRAGFSPASSAATTNQFLPSLRIRSRSFRSSHEVQRRSNAAVSILKSSIQGREVTQEDVLQVFLKERKLNGDFISKVSDAFWRRDELLFVESEEVPDQKDIPKMEEGVEDEGYTGFLKLAKTKEWIYGDSVAPMNRKLSVQERLYNSERTKKLNLLQYDALKKELLLLTVGVGVSCSLYCLLTLSVQAAVSYAVGVSFSCLYLQLLCYHSDNLSKEAVPSVFLQKSTKKIGIRSEDLNDLIERSIRGTSISLSSPRLVIPAALYGMWALSHQFANDLFDFQIVPAMFGFFAYKAAALVQVYRDNEGLVLTLPDDNEVPNDN